MSASYGDDPTVFQQVSAQPFRPRCIGFFTIKDGFYGRITSAKVCVTDNNNISGFDQSIIEVSVDKVDTRFLKLCAHWWIDIFVSTRHFVSLFPGK